MGAENTPNAQIVCPSPKVWDFEKASLGVRSPWPLTIQSRKRAYFFLELL